VLSVEELAERSGETVRTIRFYQSQGVLPPPERQGRMVRYDEGHVERLRVIAEFQQRGLRLSAIRDLLAYAPDTAPDDWQGLTETLARPWSEDRAVLLDEAALRDRLADLAPTALEELVQAGVVERRGDTSPVMYLVPSPGMLDIAIATARLGLPAEPAARLRDLLQRRLRRMADELVAEFTEAVSLERLADQGPEALARLLEQLRPLTRRTVDLLFTHEMERAQRELLDSAASPPPAPKRRKRSR
jgi:DNA-binding transcriptional MerR regulator